MSASPPRGMTTSAASGSATNRSSSSRDSGSAWTASAGRPGGGQPLAHDVEQDGVGVDGQAGAAQHAGVARLDAQGGGVDGDVRPGLVDDQDDAQRDAQLARRQAVGQLEPADGGAHGIGQGGHVADGGGKAGNAIRRQRQAVDDRRPSRPPPRRRRRRWRRGSRRPRRLDRLGDPLQRGVLGGRVERGQLAGGSAGGGGDGVECGNAHSSTRLSRCTASAIPLRPTSAAQLGRRIGADAARERRPVGPRELDAVACLERSAHLAQPDRQQAGAIVDNAPCGRRRRPSAARARGLP